MQEILEQYIKKQEATNSRFNRLAKNRFLFRLFLLRILPMASFAGLKIKSINEEQCIVSVPYTWFNKNPFRSTYFAVLSMAAEMSTGLPAFKFTYRSTPSISMLVTGVEGTFLKKARGNTYFIFRDSKQMQEAILKAISTGEGVNFKAITIGTNEEGKEIAHFVFNWSFRVKI